MVRRPIFCDLRTNLLQQKQFNLFFVCTWYVINYYCTVFKAPTKDSVLSVFVCSKRRLCWCTTAAGLQTSASEVMSLLILRMQSVPHRKQSLHYEDRPVSIKPTVPNLPYILESNPHPFYSFRGLKIRCGLDSRSRAGFWKNDTVAVRAVRTIQ
jgi:hypothetical protein